MFRTATLDDIDELLSLGEKMFAESRYKSFSLNKRKLEDGFTRILPQGLSFMSDGVLFIGMETKYFFSDDPYCINLLMYVDPNIRSFKLIKQVINEYKRRAKEKGFDKIYLGVDSLENLRTDKLFKYLGFSSVGGTYIMGEL